MLAYNEEGKTWELNPKIRQYTRINGVTEPVLNLMGPCEYFISDILTWTPEQETICIDVGGRNFGSRSSVSVSMKDIRDFLRDNSFA